MIFLRVLFLLLFFYTSSYASFSLDGTDDFVKSNTSTSLFIKEVDFSISIWFYATSNTGYVTLFSKSLSTSVREYAFFINSDTDGFWGVSETLNTTWSSSGFTANVWHNLIITRSGSTASCYLDGVLKFTATAGTAIGDSGTDLYFGKENFGGGGIQFSGKLNEFAVWKGYVLTSQDIANLSKSKIKRMPLQISPSKLSIFLPLDDHPNEKSVHALTFLDRSGNGNTATADDGANNTGMKAVAEEFLNYP